MNRDRRQNGDQLGGKLGNQLLGEREAGGGRGPRGLDKEEEGDA